MPSNRDNDYIESFAGALKALVSDKGVQAKSLANKLGYSTSRFYEILNGQMKRLPSWDNFVEPLLRECGLGSAAIADWKHRYDVTADVHQELQRRNRKLVGASAAPVDLPGRDAPRPESATAAATTAVTTVGTSTDTEPRAARAPEPPAVSGVLLEAMEDLAAVVQRQWREEMRVRAWQPEAILRIRWSRRLPTGRPPATQDPPDRTRGHLEYSADIVDELDRLVVPRLLVLGRPGSGKTFFSVRCTLRLLENRKPGSRVPVLLTATSWNPRKERLDSWLVRRLLEEYPWLANQRTSGIGVADQLVAGRHILVILDGLEEMSVEARSQALKALDLYTPEDHPLIVTCRTDEYIRGVKEYGATLPMATLRELEPVDAPEIVKYLRAGALDGDDRWLPVFTCILSEPDGPLAQALSSPLMTDLAREAYMALRADPSELLARRRFPTRGDIEQHLISRYSPRLYTINYDRRLFHVRTATRLDERTRYRYDAVAGWLSFLARHHAFPGAHEISWWQLRSTIPRWAFQAVLGTLFGVVAGLLVGAAAVFVYGPSVRALAGLGVGIGVTMGTGIMSGPRSPNPSRLDFRFRPGDVARRVPAVFAVGILSGLAFGGIFVLATVAEHGLIGIAAGLSAGVAGAAGVSLAAVMNGVLNPEDDVSQASLLKSDRAATLVASVVTAATAGLIASTLGAVMASPEKRHEVALMAGLGVAVGAALVTVAKSAWGQWLVTRLILAGSGKIPWDFVAFLDDAHRRTMLLRVGSHYVFRHDSVRSHLAGAADGPRSSGSAARRPTAEPAAP